MNSVKDRFRSLVNTVYCFADSRERCEALVESGAVIIQFRNKTMEESAFRETVCHCVERVHRHPGKLLIVNDRVDAAIKCGADGVHVGAEDEPFPDVLRRVPEWMIVGVSVDNAKEAVNAEKHGATYVGAGAVFPSATKPDAPVMGIDELRNVVRAVTIPVVAIGGITCENVLAVMRTGAHLPAVISGISDASDVGAELRRFVRIMKRRRA